MPKSSGGLIKRYSRDGSTYVWHIKKDIQGHKLRGSTGTDNRAEAEQILAQRIETLRQKINFGGAPDLLIERRAMPASPKPRGIKLKDAPAYLGVSKYQFNELFLPQLILIEVDSRTTLVDRRDLDLAFDEYKKSIGKLATRPRERDSF